MTIYSDVVRYGLPQSPSVVCARCHLEGYVVIMRKSAQCPQQPSMIGGRPHVMASDIFTSTVHLAERIETICSDVVRYGLASSPSEV